MTAIADRESVLFANEAFYRAFADRDGDAMEAIWAEKEPVACIHPGWPALIGREAVMTSWQRILANPDSPAVEITGARAFVLGDVAMVICYEVVEGQALVATNLFRRDGTQWKIIHHQAGPTPRAPREETGDLPNRPN